MNSKTTDRSEPTKDPTFDWAKAICRLDVTTRSSNSVTTEDVLNALGRYTRESDESDRQTATKLGINRLTLKAWFRGVVPQRCLVARLAGFLRRAGYL